MFVCDVPSGKFKNKDGRGDKLIRVNSVLPNSGNDRVLCVGVAIHLHLVQTTCFWNLCIENVSASRCEDGFSKKTDDCNAFVISTEEDRISHALEVINKYIVLKIEFMTVVRSEIRPDEFTVGAVVMV